MIKKRKHELVDATTDPVVAPFVWDLCLLCQKHSKERLIIPKYEGYLTMAKNLGIFAEHGQLPSGIRHLKQLDDGNGVLQTLVAHAAKYHKSCKNKYDSQKAERISSEKVARTQIRSQKDRPLYSDQTPSASKLTRSSLFCSDLKNVCLFCDEGGKDNLVIASTLGIGPTIHSHAVKLQDEKLLKKLTSTDLVALEANYHKLCYTRFLTRARAAERSQREDYHNPEEVVYGTVITELVQYMQDLYSFSSISPVFKLSCLTKLVIERMTNLGIQTEEKNINRTRLKEQLLAFTPGLRADKSGREIILSFEGDDGDAIRDACAFNDFSDGMCLGRAVRILRRQLFEDFPKFEGSFNKSFTASASVPAVLIHFVRMLLEGPNVESVGSSEEPAGNNAELSISQLIRYNSIKHKRKENDTVSTFCGIGKKTSWKVWMSFREIDCVWNQLCTGTSDIDDECHNLLQRFIVLLYDKTSDIQNINECRRVLFTRKNRAIENIPPTADALRQHIKRAAFQARIWNNSLDLQYTVPSPTHWGWSQTSEGSYQPVWTTIPEVSKHSVELTSCTCHKRCTSEKCKCVKMGVRCTKLCVCEGQCSESDW